MWGCIEFFRYLHLAHGVPSLYVRVYRWSSVGKFRKRSSLIICEGVSAYETGEVRQGMFPHYMWGCIAQALFFLMLRVVPSLYVRVYRSVVVLFLYRASSLIICEGVSNSKSFSICRYVFPHYMWGCIGNFCGFECHFRGSLIICEGVSTIQFMLQPKH